MKTVSEIQGNNDGLILKTIEDVLISIFGDKTFNNLLIALKRNYALEWREIPRRSKEFSLALHQILGTGSMIIEDLIIESLYNNLGLELIRRKDFSFSDYISELKELKYHP